jgi:hypothetical protein
MENGAMAASAFSRSARHGADFGDRRGERAGQQSAAGDRNLRLRLAGGDQVDQVVLEQQRRARQHRQRDVGLIGCERINHHLRGLLRGGEYFGERAPHQRRGIVQKHDHRAFGGGEIVGGQFGM